MDSLDNDFSTSEVIHCSLSEQIKKATELILRQIEDYALYGRVETSWKPLETAKLRVLDQVTRLLALRTTGTIFLVLWN